MPKNLSSFEDSKVMRFNNPRYIETFTDAELTTSQTFHNYLHRLTTLAESRFTWTNLPPNVTSRLIERGLFRHGSIVFYKHTLPIEDENRFLNEDTSRFDMYDGRYFTLPYTYETLDVYGDPVDMRSYGLDGYNHNLINGIDAIIIRNNTIGTSTYDTIHMFAARLTNALRTQDLNLHQQKHPALLLCEESQKRTLQAITKKIDSFEPFIFGVRNMLDAEKAIRSIDLGAPYIADRLTEYKNDLWDEVLTFLGIANSSRKKERMITQEAQANGQFATASINVMLESRREAMYAINDMFNLNIDVHANDLSDTLYKEYEMEVENEPLY